jgi:type IV fimbrial biogenesis protein FimT
MSILWAIAVPAFHEIIQSFRSSVALNTLSVALNYARSEAVSRNSVIRLCASMDGKTCSASKQWEHGWITYLDVTGDSSRTEDDPVLQYYPAVNGVTIRKNGREGTVKFSPDGTVGLNRSFSFCTVDRSRPISRVVVIHTGRIRLDEKNVDCDNT